MAFSRVCVLALASACVETPRLASTEQQACSMAMCGNTPKLFGPFYELDMTGSAFSPLGKYRITSFQQGGVELKLTVAGFDVAGTPLGGGPRLVNEELEGAVLYIEQAGNEDRVEVTLTDVASTLEFYEGADTNATLPTFKLDFEVVTAATGEHSAPQPVCPAGTTTTFDRHALLFSGNRYSIDGGVTESGAEAHPWFNITCNDTAQWKAALFRLVAVAETDAFPSEPSDYAAAVRSTRADYCGNGFAHTVLGANVDWENRGGWLTKTDGLTLEAVWDENGAICLSNPRLPDLDPDEIDCELRRCTRDDFTNWQANGHLMATWVPPDP